MIDPQSAFLLGVLVASVKGIGIAAVGAGIAWWRARRRVRELEGQLADAASGAMLPGLADLERTLEYLTAQVDAIAEQQQELVHRLPAPRERALPPSDERTPRG